MAVVSGVLSVGEANATLRDIQRRSGNSRWFVVFVAVAPLVGGMGLAVLLTRLFRRPDGEQWLPEPFAILIGLALGWAIYLFGMRRFMLWRFRRRFTARGIPLDLPMQIELGLDELIYSVGETTLHAKWTCVLEIFPSRGYWIATAQASTVFVPKRFFPDAAGERAFIAEALSRMSDTARGRSPEAVRFASWE